MRTYLFASGLQGHIIWGDVITIRKDFSAINFVAGEAFWIKKLIAFLKAA
jgi:hypothetical protein